MKSLSTVAVALTMTFAVYACGGDDDDTAGPGADGGVDASKDAPADTNAPSRDASKDVEAPKIRCTPAELDQNDFTAADAGAVEITFNTGANPTQYTNHCVKVKAGSSVTFSGSFFQHPLEPAGGDEPNPIPKVNKEPAGGVVVVTFPSAGTFGYQCTFHPVAMFGAIQVVP